MWMVDKTLSAIHFFYRGVFRLSVEEGVLTFLVLRIIDGVLGMVVTLSRMSLYAFGGGWMKTADLTPLLMIHVLKR